MKKLDETEIIKIFQKGLGKKKFESEDVEILNFDKVKIIAKTLSLHGICLCHTLKITQRICSNESIICILFNSINCN